jgi:alpha-beta hydrolase superfamily lysophospholipase
MFLLTCMDRDAWDVLAADLAAEGSHVLTVDLRGFGENGGKATNVAEFDALSAKRAGDVDAMLAYLREQSGADTLSRVAAGGASCGVTLSTDFAARHNEIRTLIELSGLATDATKAYITQTPGVAIFGAASEGDGGPPRA